MADELMNEPEVSHQWLRGALCLPQGQSPFPWQTRLLADFVDGRLPSALDLPTGLGKTAVIAIWLVARALGAPVPRRLIYVVDRRAVVDQATRVAEQLRAWVDTDTDVAKALGLQGPLPISTLRGQHADNRSWLADPASPAIVLGTVDMVGSRLLFGGYAVSRKMRPYHAGLMGADAWIVLDEAHLVPPFERLVAQIVSRSDADGRALTPAAAPDADSVPPLRLLSLSATGRRPTAGHVFALDADDTGHPVVRQRLEARKRLMPFPAVTVKELPDTLARHAWDLTGKGSRPARVIVFVTSRDHAQKVKQAIDRFTGRPERTELFVGGRRVFERELAAARLQTLGFLAGSVAEFDGPSFLVSTSAGEVGVDLDADHAVCDVVAWERLVQRLGRVNRRGTGDAAVALVPLVLEDQQAQALQQAVLNVVASLPLHRDGSHDASPSAFTALKAQASGREAIERASTPAPLHPPLTRALVDAWAMTSLDTHTGRPEVAPWLRGWPDQAEPLQTTVAWRRHLPVTEAGRGRLFGPRDLEVFWEAAEVHLTEALQTDTPAVVEWLLARSRSVVTRAADEAAAGGDDRLGRDQVMGIVLRDATADVSALRAAELLATPRRDLDRQLAGATLVMDRRAGGLVDGLLVDDADEAAIDVSELGSTDPQGPVPFWVSRVEPDELERAPQGWRAEASFVLSESDDGVVAWLVVRSRIGQQAASEEGRSGAQRAQLLEEHQSWAEAAARRLAVALHLPAPHADTLALAALLHDEGKRARRWQAAFHAPEGDRMPYAKTKGRPNLALLDGYRHEFGSLAYAEADPRVEALSPALRDLCLHLIAAHHGAARPVIRTQGAEEPPSLATQRAREVALRYAALSKTWGPWGLAWWEALLRAADQQASRRNDDAGRVHG